jgi:hypothetical protein
MIRPLVLAIFAIPTLSVAADESPSRIVSVKTIWDQGGYQMCTDLIRHDGQFFCTFREGDEHIPGMNGKIRVIASNNGEAWESVCLLGEQGLDLRDPKLYPMQDGRMMLLFDGASYAGDEKPKVQRKNIGGQTMVAFSTDRAKTWGKPKAVLPPNEWLWRLTWRKGKGYGVAYTYFPKKQGYAIRLYSTTDGEHYDLIAKLDPGGYLNESTIRFLADDTAVMLSRRENDNLHAFIGTSKPPYKDWTWKDSGHELGGPDFIVLPDRRMFAGGRRKLHRDGKGNSVVFGRLTLEKFEPLLELPATNDGGYPGFVLHDGLLYMSYYADPDGGNKANIYLAKIQLPPK